MSINPNQSLAQSTMANSLRRPGTPPRCSLEASQADHMEPSSDLPAPQANDIYQVIETAIQTKQNNLKQQFIERGQLEVALLNQMIEQKQQHPINQNLMNQQLKVYQRTVQTLQKTLETIGRLLTLHPQAKQVQASMETLQTLQTDAQAETPEAVRQRLNERLPHKSSTLENIQASLPSPNTIAKLANQDTGEWSEWLLDIHERWFATKPAPAPSNPFSVAISKQAL